MPMTSPSASNIGPPELPRLIGASVWIASTRLKPDVIESIERSVAETTPTLSELSWPKGLPIAATGSPTTTAARVAERHRADRVVGGIDLEDADVVEDVPADDLRRDALAVAELDVDACPRRPASRSASASPAVVMTCEFVRM